MSAIPTPRTDEASRITSVHRYDDSFADPDHGWVCASFARQLECELAIEQKNARALRDALSEFVNQVSGFEHQTCYQSDVLAFKKARAIIAKHSE